MQSFGSVGPDGVGVIVRGAHNGGRRLLDVAETRAVGESLGLRFPRYAALNSAVEVDRLDLTAFPGDRVVVKAEGVAHRSEMGAVQLCAGDHAAIGRAITTMERRLRGREYAGFSVNEFVPVPKGVGGELLLGARWTDEFGPVIILGLGGTDVERLTAWEPLFVAGERELGPAMPEILGSHSLGRHLTEPYRGLPPKVSGAGLLEALGRLTAFCLEQMPPVAEIEFNPVVAAGDGLIALDGLVRLADERSSRAEPRPLEKLRRLLEPRSVAVAGVSRRLNPGRIILGNILREGFDGESVYVLKPGGGEIEGCRCVEGLDGLPQTVDLLVVSLAAEQVPEIVEQAIATNAAESMILIPGGLGERSGSGGRVDRIRKALSSARARPDRGPVINGGNCLGVRSRPGRVDTMFIPEHKLSYAGRRKVPLALIAQSGAFAVARMSRWWALDPLYVVSTGNQIDLTAGDYLEYLKDDARAEVFACYLEGFRPGDGERWLEAAAEITAAGNPVVLYRAGRTQEGAAAAAAHTATVAGEYAVTRQLAERAGVLVADTLTEFDDLVTACCLLRERTFGGNRLAALSNAGFESVAIADRLGGLTFASLGEETKRRLSAQVDRLRLGSVVAVTNPLDLTPIFDDEAFAAATEALLHDPNVDLGLVGCVPLTGALSTLAKGGDHSEDFTRTGALGARLRELWVDTDKPWAVAVDGGPPYDAFARDLLAAGIPTFPSVDRALSALERVCRWSLRFRSSAR